MLPNCVPRFESSQIESIPVSMYFEVSPKYWFRHIVSVYGCICSVDSDMTFVDFSLP